MFKGDDPGHRSRYIIASLCCIALMMTACNDGSAPQDPDLPPPPQNSAPSAVISSVRDTVERTTITVDGSGSTDPDGSISVYAWSLTTPSDFEISLTVSDEPTTEIEIGEIADDVTLEISLIVMDNQGATASTSTSVFVEEIDFDLLPPDPGSLGQTTVEGVDSDFDGVRDDVEIVIYRLNELNTPKRMFLNEVARGLQSAILAGESGANSAVEEAAITTSDALFCLSLLQQEDPSFQVSKEVPLLLSLAVNTQDRRDAKQSYNNISTQLFTIGDVLTISQCAGSGGI